MSIQKNVFHSIGHLEKAESSPSEIVLWNHEDDCDRKGSPQLSSQEPHTVLGVENICNSSWVPWVPYDHQFHSQIQSLEKWKYCHRTACTQTGHHAKDRETTSRSVTWRMNKQTPTPLISPASDSRGCAFLLLNEGIHSPRSPLWLTLSFASLLFHSALSITQIREGAGMRLNPEPCTHQANTLPLSYTSSPKDQNSSN